MDKNILFDWVFSFNPYTNLYRAAKREHYNELFSGGENTISSSDIRTLEEIILKTNGNIKEADKLLENERN